jgi:hypothetical protein
MVKRFRELTGSRNLVGGDGRSLLAVDVDTDTGVGHGVATWELDLESGRWGDTSTTAEDELST